MVEGVSSLGHILIEHLGLRTKDPGPVHPLELLPVLANEQGLSGEGIRRKRDKQSRLPSQGTFAKTVGTELHLGTFSSSGSSTSSLETVSPSLCHGDRMYVCMTLCVLCLLSC